MPPSDLNFADPNLLENVIWEMREEIKALRLQMMSAASLSQVSPTLGTIQGTGYFETLVGQNIRFGDTDYGYTVEVAGDVWPADVIASICTGPSGNQPGDGGYFLAGIDDGDFPADGDYLGKYVGGGHNGSGDLYLSGAFTMVADGAWSSGIAPSKLGFETMPHGGGARAVRAWIHADGEVTFLTSLYVGSDNVAPDNEIYAEGNITTSGSAVQLQCISTAASSTTSGGRIYATENDGAIMADTHRLGAYFFGGYDGGATRVGAAITAFADGAWTQNSSYPTRLAIEVCASGAGSTRTAALGIRANANIEITNNYLKIGGCETSWPAAAHVGFLGGGASCSLTLPNSAVTIPANAHGYLHNDGAGVFSWDPGGAGVGDMTKAIYDPNDDGIIAPSQGGTGVANAGTLTNATNTTITGGGTIALAGYTLTVPATGTVVLDKDVKCRVRSDTAQTLTTATITPLTFNVEVFDTDAIHDNSTNNTRLTCKTAGTYVISGGVQFAANATGRRAVLITGNIAALGGATTLATQHLQAVTDSGKVTSASVATIVELAVNDYVEFNAFQASGGNLDTEVISVSSPHFEMVLVHKA